MLWRENRKRLAEAIGAHPRFVPAMRHYTAAFLEWRSGLGVLNKMLSNLGREHLLEHVLYYHFMRMQAPEDPGATFERVAALSGARDLIGPRATRSALALAQTAGLISAGRSPLDRRLRVLEPTELLLRLTREAYALPFGIFDEIAPDLRIRERLHRDPGYISLVLSRLAEAYRREEFVGQAREDGYQNVLRLEGGRPILATAIDCYWGGRDLPPSQEIAWRYYVSASQIRAVLKNAEHCQLIRTAARGRLLDAGPLATAYLEATCYYLALYARHAFGLDEEDFAPGGRASRPPKPDPASLG